jgi:arsenate reductase
MTHAPYNILLLCTENSARSILAEAITNNLVTTRGKFRAFSVGSYPKGEVNPFALELLRRNGMSTAGLRSKSWNEFEQADGLKLDFAFTVCDQAAGEQCPYWPGQPLAAHWGVSGPAAVEGSNEDKRSAFLDTFMVLRRRIDLFANLPLEKLDRLALQKHLTDIGRQ